MLKDYESPSRGTGWGWSRIPIPRGTSVHGVIAGPVRIALTHYIKDESKPCRRWCTQGAVRCYCEDGPTPHREYGYQPLVLRDMSQVVVILCKSVALNLKKIDHGTPVEIIAPPVEKKKTFFRTSLGDTIPSSVVAAVKARKPANIDEFLIYCLWHDEEVCQHFNKSIRKEDEQKRPKLNLIRKPKKPEPAPVCDTPLSLSDFVQGIGLNPNSKT